MKLNNQKGLITLFMIAPYIIGLGFTVIGYGAIKTNYSTKSFRERKAMGYCVSEGKSESDCKTFVSGMEKGDVLSYIKDTQENPR